MYAMYGNIYHQYTPFMLAYIPAPWILWGLNIKELLFPTNNHYCWPHGHIPESIFQALLTTFSHGQRDTLC